MIYFQYTKDQKSNHFNKKKTITQFSLGTSSHKEFTKKHIFFISFYFKTIECKIPNFRIVNSNNPNYLKNIRKSKVNIIYLL